MYSGRLRAKAIYLVKIDVEERRLGSKKGLDTQVFLSVNDEWLVTQSIKAEDNSRFSNSI